MTTNYNTTNGEPFKRVSKIIAEYGVTTDELIGIQVHTEHAMVTASGTVVLVSGTQKSFTNTFSLTDLMAGSFPLVDNTTGEATGETGTYLQLFKLMASFIRQQEKLNDVEEV